MSKRIPALKFDDLTWEGEGSSPDLAVAEASASYWAARRESLSGDGACLLGTEEVEFDVFLTVRIRADNSRCYRAVLR